MVTAPAAQMRPAISSHIAMLQAMPSRMPSIVTWPMPTAAEVAITTAKACGIAPGSSAISL